MSSSQNDECEKGPLLRPAELKPCASSLARARAATAGAGRELFVGRPLAPGACAATLRLPRTEDSETSRTWRVCGFGGCGGSGCGPCVCAILFVILAIFILGVSYAIVLLLFKLYHSDAWRRERESFVVVVAEGRMAAAAELEEWDERRCTPGPPKEVTVVIETADIAFVRGSSNGTVEIFLKDPSTGERRLNRPVCCFSTLSGPDLRLERFEKGVELLRALQTACSMHTHSASGAAKGALTES